VPPWCILICYSTAKDLWHNTLLVIGNGTFHANQVPADFPDIKKYPALSILGEKNGVAR
jgi:hypothetical protein